MLKRVGTFEHLLPAPRQQPTAPRHGRRPHRAPARHERRAIRQPRHSAGSSPADPFARNAPAYLALAAWLGLLLLGVTTAITVDRRLRNRLIRSYERYEIKLSMHDDAKPGDLEDMVEAIGAAVRKRYNDRVSQGQPFIALELWHRPSAVGMQWTPCLVCEAHIARTLEGLIAGAYPDVRVGREFERAAACDRRASWTSQAYVMRFRKRRAFIHPLGHPAPAAAQRQGKTTPLSEAIAMTQTALATPSLVRFQITPASEQLEDAHARRRLERHEHQLLHDTHGDSGHRLDQAETRSASRCATAACSTSRSRSARRTGRPATGSPRASSRAAARTICTAATW